MNTIVDTIIQSWDGWVDVIEDDYFIASIKGRTEQSIDDFVVIKFEELSENDRACVKIGAHFIWNVFRRDIGNNRQTMSEIKFTEEVNDG